MVLLDISPEILTKRKSLKPVTNQLKTKNMCCRWSSTSDIVVVKDEVQFKAEGLAFERTLLSVLDIALPPS